VFSATSNKREIADKQKLDETSNISRRCHETCLLFRKRGEQVKIRTCQ